MRRVLRIASARAPFRRAGLAWSAKGKAGAIEVDVCDLDGERLVRLIREPVLRIEVGMGDGEFMPMPAIDPTFTVDHAQMLIDAERERRTEFQSAQGGEGRSGDAAADPGAPELKDEEVKDASSADPEGTSPDAASGDEESREGTDAGSAAAAAPVDGEKQPESSPKAPVAAQEIAEGGTAGDKPAGSRRRKA